MTKRISVSMADWVYEKYLSDLQNLNRSKFIEEMMVKGIDVELNQSEVNRVRLIEAMKEIRKISDELVNTKRELVLVKARVVTQENRKQEREEERRKKEAKKEAERLEEERILAVEKEADAIKLSGFLEMIGRGDKYDKGK